MSAIPFINRDGTYQPRALRRAERNERPDCARHGRVATRGLALHPGS
jgi:hypothetical protein